MYLSIEWFEVNFVKQQHILCSPLSILFMELFSYLVEANTTENN